MAKKQSKALAEPSAFLVKKIQREHAHDDRELGHWLKERHRPKRKLYFFYLVLILTSVYIVDEVATNLNSTMQSYMVDEFFVSKWGLDLNTAQSRWQIGVLAALILSFTSLIYRPLADRYGRKIFLVINTAMMALGMLLCFFSPEFWVYYIGFFFLCFMTGPDMQVVYLSETAPPKHRATFLALIKGIAQLGIALIGLGMEAFMKGNAERWRYVFLIPAILGFVVSFLALFFARETDQFIEKRIAYLSLSDEEKIALLSDKKTKQKESQGGLFQAIIFAFHHPQLRAILLLSLLYTTAFYATAYYGTIMKDAGLSDSELTHAALIWPFVCSGITILYGLLSDKFGRKVVSFILAGLLMAGLLFLCLGLSFSWSGYLLGVFLGLFLAGYWNWGDTVGLMAGESAPTNYRSSIAAAQNLFAGGGYLLGMLASLLFTRFSGGGVAYLDYLFLGLAVPGVSGALLLLAFQVHETKGLDLAQVTGEEWDGKAKQ
jgi:MFS family permease